MKNIFPFSTFFYQIHILQLENYNLPRFIRACFPKIFFADTEKDKDIVWTPKLQLVVFLALGLKISFLWMMVEGLFPHIFFDVLTTLLLLVALSPLFAVFLFVATLLLSPLDVFAKERIIRKAKILLSSHDRIQVIGITGSYGKTTTKELLRHILGMRYNVVATRDSFNTALSVSMEILEKVTEETDIFIAEMGAHEKGDIEKVCSVSGPNISILTGINEAHLERFGSIENTIRTKFEIIEACSPDGLIVLNADDERVRSSYKTYCGNQEIAWVSKEANPLSHYTVKNISFSEETLGISFTLFREQKEIGTINTRFLGEYIINNAIIAFIVGNKLGMSDAEIQAGLMSFKPVAHRLNPQKTPNDMIVIDDSYNGNPKGVSAAIHALSLFKNRRKIYITPGLVEVGEESNDIHQEIGRELGKVADFVFLIENSTTASIKKGLFESGFDESNIYSHKNKKDTYKKLGQLSRSGDVILFQNDWPENYA